MLGIDPVRWQELLETDGEFLRASRLWNGSFAFFDGSGHLRVEVLKGKPVSVDASVGEPEAITVFSGPPEGWQFVFAEMPPPYYQDLIGGAVGRHGFVMRGDATQMATYYGAIQRAVRLAARARKDDS